MTREKWAAIRSECAGAKFASGPWQKKVEKNTSQHKETCVWILCEIDPPGKKKPKKTYRLFADKKDSCYIRPFCSSTKQNYTYTYTKGDKTKERTKQTTRSAGITYSIIALAAYNPVYACSGGLHIWLPKPRGSQLLFSSSLPKLDKDGCGYHWFIFIFLVCIWHRYTQYIV